MTRTNQQPSRGRRWLAAFSALILVVMAGLIPMASVSAADPTNMVLVWNENAVAVLSAPQVPPVTTPPTVPVSVSTCMSLATMSTLSVTAPTCIVKS